MISYIIEASICWSGFYGLYLLLFRQTTFFTANRAYLLGSLLLGLLLPLAGPWLPANEATAAAAYYLQPITVGVGQLELTSASPKPEASINYLSLLKWLYAVGALFMAFRMAGGLRQVAQLYYSGQREKQLGYTLVRTASAHPPFSFWNCIFLSSKTPLSSADQNVIIQHELAHISGRHSLDLLLAELLCVLFWCSPLPYGYARSLRNVHEYLADQAVLRTARRKEYGHLLLRQSQSGPAIAFANHFFQTQLKLRITMMTQRKTSPSSAARYLLALPLVLLFVLAFHRPELIGQITVDVQLPDGTTISRHEVEDMDQFKFPNPDAIQSIDVQKEAGRAIVTLKSSALERPSAQDTLPDGGEEVFKVVEEMPRFPGCEEEDAVAREQCAQRRMLEFIYNEVKYPKSAREAGAQGMTVVQFIVEKDGSVTNWKLVRDPGAGLGDEALRVIAFMAEQVQWVPGKQRGRKVRVQFVLPIKFKLSDSSAEAPKPQASAEPLALRDFSAAPNPSSGTLRVQFEGEPGSLLLRLLDMEGRELLRRSLPQFDGQFDEVLDLSQMPKGNLVLQVSQADRTFAQLLTLQ